jgi:SHS2 domain-containing protein
VPLGRPASHASGRRTLDAKPDELEEEEGRPLEPYAQEQEAALMEAASHPGPPRWEHFAHAADMGVRGVGSSLPEAFEQGALAMTALVTDPANVQIRDRVTIECSAPDMELLFVDWLNSIVYEMAIRHMVFGKFAVALDGTRLTAEVWGERIDVHRHHPAVEVKGATYTDLRVANEETHWVAQTVVDV